jgi:protoporphyrinogen oxidase
VPTPTVAVLGGGLAGMAAAWELARAGFAVTLVERGAELGGLAGSFERGGHVYPLGYHHILGRDQTLLAVLGRIGALPDVRWRRVRMLFHRNGSFYNLGSPAGFLRFPMSPADKARFVRLMLRAFRTSDWSEWQGRGGDELIDAWGGPGVRAVLFEDLCRLKFDLPSAEVSAAWLGARLHFREGSAPLGYIPGDNWTRVLCDGVARELAAAGVEVRLNTAVQRLLSRPGDARGARLVAADLVDGRGEQRLEADLFVSALPAEVYMRSAPADATPHLADIRSTALLSAVCATRQRVRPDFYWLNLLEAKAGFQSCGIFLLSSLNPTIGAPGETCVNFVTHLGRRDHPLFLRSEEEILAGYRQDFRRLFGCELEAEWVHLSRVASYSPVFHRGYRNPPVRSASFSNVYFAGNYRTFPSIASTGTALESGFEAAREILADRAGWARAFDRRRVPREVAHA